MKIKTVNHDLPAYWATALVNNDYSGLSEHHTHELAAWKKVNNYVNCLCCSDETIYGYFDGLLCDLLTYTFTKPKVERVKNTIMVDGKRKVCRIFDNDGATFDRFTIAFKGYRLAGYGMVYPYLASSENPFHPQGFGQHSESREFLTGKHLGKRVRFESLPVDVQTFILNNI